MNEPDQNFVAVLMENQFGITPVSIMRLQQHEKGGRGIWCIADANGRRYVLRMIRGDTGAWLDQPARVLQWLHHADFLAPRLHRSLHGTRIVHSGGWYAALLDFVEGTLVSPSPPVLSRLAAVTRRLHALQPTTIAASSLPLSWKDPKNAIPAILKDLEQARSAVPREQAAIAVKLEGMLRIILEQSDRLPRCLVHGDCWHHNAVQTPSGEIVLIDWDGAGWGTPLIDLGELLLTCHYDFTQPTVINVDRAKIGAILDGYDARNTLTPPERDLLLHGIRYMLAFHGADWLRNQELWPKFVARFNATEEIARVANQMLDSS